MRIAASSSVEAQLGTSDTRPHALERRLERRALDAADATGKALATAGFSLLLSLITSVLGAVLALHRPRRKGERPPRRTVHNTEPGYSPPVEPVTTSPPYPTPMTGPGTPIVPTGDVAKP